MTRTRWDDLADAEQLTRDLRHHAMRHDGSDAQNRAEHAERTLARMEMGDDVDD